MCAVSVNTCCLPGIMVCEGGGRRTRSSSWEGVVSRTGHAWPMRKCSGRYLADAGGKPANWLGALLQDWPGTHARVTNFCHKASGSDGVVYSQGYSRTWPRPLPGHGSETRRPAAHPDARSTRVPEARARLPAPTFQSCRKKKANTAMAPALTARLVSTCSRGSALGAPPNDPMS